MGQQRKLNRHKTKGEGQPTRTKPKRTLYELIREWTDPLVIAFVLAMFIRTFVVELFKIPSGSMTPTLIGDYFAEFDYDGDGDDDLVLWGNRIQVFFREDGKYVGNATVLNVAGTVSRDMFERREDMILVSKMAYWFSRPDRGDIAVFKVPKKEGSPFDPWDPKKPVYIKRVIGLPGEQVGIFFGKVLIDGKTLDDLPQIEGIEYVNSFGYREKRVPEGQIFMFGDNSRNSLDSRRWGGVPIENFKGKAIFRYWPLKYMGFLK